MSANNAITFEPDKLYNAVRELFPAEMIYDIDHFAWGHRVKLYRPLAMFVSLFQLNEWSTRTGIAFAGSPDLADQYLDVAHPEYKAGNTGLSVQTLLDTLKAIGEQYAEDNPDYLWIELYRDGSWGIKFETHDPDSETEELMEGDSISDDFISNVAHWLENQ